MKFEEYESKFIEFLREEEQHKSKTISSIIEGTKYYFKHYSKIDIKTLIKYREFLINSNFKPATINLRIYAINRFSKFFALQNLTKEKIALINKGYYHLEYPTIKSVPIQKKITLDNVITLEEYEQLKQSFLKSKNMDMYFGIRMAAAAGLRPSKIHMITNEGLLTGIQDIKSKRNKTRTVYFINSLSEEYKEYLKSLNKEINLKEKVVKYNQKNFARILKQEAKKLKLNLKIIYPYSLRHLFGKMFQAKTKNLSLLSDIMGHENINTTRIYTRLSKEEQLIEMNRIVDWA